MEAVSRSKPKEWEKTHDVTGGDRRGRRILDQAVRPNGRRQHRRSLIRKQIQSSRRIQSYPQVFLTTIGFFPIEIGPNAESHRSHINYALKPKQRRTNEKKKGNET